MKVEKAKLVVQGMKEAGINFAVGVPDAQFIEVYKMAEQDPDIQYVGAANEAEAAGISMGAWLGGKKNAPGVADPGLFGGAYHIAPNNPPPENSPPILHPLPRGLRGPPRAGPLP